MCTIDSTQSQTTTVTSTEPDAASRPRWLRRGKQIALQSDENVTLDIDQLLDGGVGFVLHDAWRLVSAYSDEALKLTSGQLEFLLEFPSEQWTTTENWDAEHWLLVEPLLSAEVFDIASSAASPVDNSNTDPARGWWSNAAVYHRTARWENIDAVEGAKAAGGVFLETLLDRRGSPPQPRRNDASEAIALSKHELDDFDEELAKRVTCRNFDTTKPLPLEILARVLRRTLGAQHVLYHDGMVVTIKKNVPSGGGFHSVEAYLVARNVKGLDRGLYYYDAIDHSLAHLPDPEMPLDEFASLALARQEYFAQAPVLLVLAPRFPRCYWKYRNHTKAYRVTIVDTGHISQLLFSCAQREGLGAFFTSAINEIDIENAFDMAPLEQSPLGICGLGWRTSRQVESEMDPGEHIWRRCSP